MRASRFGADLDNRISVNPNKKAFVVAPLTGNDCDMFQGPKLIPIGGLYTRLISHLHQPPSCLKSLLPPSVVTLVTNWRPWAFSRCSLNGLTNSPVAASLLWSLTTKL